MRRDNVQRKINVQPYFTNKQKQNIILPFAPEEISFYLSDFILFASFLIILIIFFLRNKVCQKMLLLTARRQKFSSVVFHIRNKKGAPIAWLVFGMHSEIPASAWKGR